MRLNVQIFRRHNRKNTHTNVSFLGKAPLQDVEAAIPFQLREQAGSKVQDTYFLFAHPVVNLLGVSVEKLQVHALFVLLPAKLPQFQKGSSFAGKDVQLKEKGGVCTCGVGSWSNGIHRSRHLYASSAKPCSLGKTQQATSRPPFLKVAALASMAP